MARLSGLQITANGKPLSWTRDPVDVFAFHLTVSPGVASLNVVFQHLSPVTPASAREASAKLPTDWKIASALDLVKRDAMRTGDWYEFKPVSLETLIDLPLWAGKYFERIELDTKIEHRITSMWFPTPLPSLRPRSSTSTPTSNW